MSSSDPQQEIRATRVRIEARMVADTRKEDELARGRVITPDFWTDGNMVGVSPHARLFYIGMWNFAHCDKGHLDDDAMGLKLKILPADQVDAHGLLAELVGCGRLTRIRAANGKSYLCMPSFERHQKTDVRWKTRCPACALINSGELTETPVSFGELSETLPASALREEKRTEMERTEPEKNSSSPTAMDYAFDEAWSHWPKKVERKKAAEQYAKAVKKLTAPVLAAHVIRFGDAYAATTERQFVPALGVWLNGERWTDELPTASQSKQSAPVAKADQNAALFYELYGGEHERTGSIQALDSGIRS